MAIDVRSPLNPVEAGGFSGDGITHETQVVKYRGPDAQYYGREIAFNSNAKTGATQDTFSIVDVTNKSAMTRLSTQFYPGVGVGMGNDHTIFATVAGQVKFEGPKKRRRISVYP